MAVSSTGKQTGYVAKESSYGTGIALANGDAIQFTSLSTDAIQGNVDRSDKTGSASRAKSIQDTRRASWNAVWELCGSGTAGTADDADAFFENLGGKKTVNSGVSIVYECDDVEGSLTIGNFDKPTGNDQEVVIGAVVEQATFSIGAPIPTVQMSGSGMWAIRKSQYATLDATGKGGYGAFPTEPASPTVLGTPPKGRTGSIVIDGVTYAIFQEGSISFSTGVTLGPSQFGSIYPSGPRRTRRAVSVDFSLEDDGGSDIAALMVKVLAGTAIDATFTIGTVAGNIHAFLIKNIVLPQPQFDRSGNARVFRFQGAPAAASSATAKDEWKYTRT